MTDPKEQAVPVVGVDEAVEAMQQALKYPVGDTTVVSCIDLRTILRALQGSSACADTHRATEQPVVGLPHWNDLTNDERTALVKVAAFNVGGTDAEYYDGQIALDLYNAIRQQAATRETAPVGTQSRSDEVHEKAQLKAAYEALEDLRGVLADELKWVEAVERSSRCHDTRTGAIGRQTAIRQALARRGEG